MLSEDFPRSVTQPQRKNDSLGPSPAMTQIQMGTLSSTPITEQEELSESSGLESTGLARIGTLSVPSITEQSARCRLTGRGSFHSALCGPLTKSQRWHHPGEIPLKFHLPLQD